MMFIIVLGILSSSFHPVMIVKAVLNLAPLPQALTIASIVTSYLLFSSMFNRALVVSPQLTYIKHLPIEPKALLAAHAVSLYILNLFFLVAYVFALVIASYVIELSWYDFIVLFVTGSIGTALGQVYYAWARTQTLSHTLAGTFGFFFFNGCFGYLFALAHNPNGQPLNLYLIIFCILYLCIAFWVAHYAVRCYIQGDLQPVPLLQIGRILNFKGIVSLTLVDFIALWRIRKLEFIFRVVLCGICLIFTILSVLNNTGRSNQFYNVFVLTGSMLIFMLLSTIIVVNRQYRKSATWVRTVLPLEHREVWFADYVTLSIVSVPVIFVYMCAGTWLFQMRLSAITIQAGSIMALILLLSAGASLLSFWRIAGSKGFVFIQLSLGIVAIIIYTQSMMAYACFALLAQIPVIIIGFEKFRCVFCTEKDKYIAYR